MALERVKKGEIMVAMARELELVEAGARGAMCLATDGAAGAPGAASIGLRPAASIERRGRPVLRVRVKALDDAGRLALFGADGLALGERITVVMGAGLRFEAVVVEKRHGDAIVVPKGHAKPRADRHVVNQTGCRLVLACGAEAVCDVVDVSATGLFVRTDEPLAVGETVRIGRTTGRVVRATQDGFGISIEPATTLRSTLRAI